MRCIYLCTVQNAIVWVQAIAFNRLVYSISISTRDRHLSGRKRDHWSLRLIVAFYSIHLFTQRIFCILVSSSLFCQRISFNKKTKHIRTLTTPKIYIYLKTLVVWSGWVIKKMRYTKIGVSVFARQLWMSVPIHSSTSQIKHYLNSLSLSLPLAFFLILVLCLLVWWMIFTPNATIPFTVLLSALSALHLITLYSSPRDIHIFVVHQRVCIWRVWNGNFYVTTYLFAGCICCHYQCSCCYCLLLVCRLSCSTTWNCFEWIKD